MNFFLKIILIIFLTTSKANAENVTNWLKSEIDNILNAYKNESISNVERFEYIEKTINTNFAGSSIAKFVAGQAWGPAEKETKKRYIKLFKRHLALNIASMMRAYSDQTYSLISLKNDNTNNIILIDMEIQDQSNKLLITWRVKEAKDTFYIIDLLVANISLIVTKRSEFNSMLKKVDYNLKSFNEILNKQNELSYNILIQ